MAIKDIVKGICNITRCKYDVYTKEKTDELFSDVYTKGNFAVITGTLTTENTKPVIAYPDGFDKDNCVVLSVGFYQSTTGSWGFTEGTFDTFGSGYGAIQKTISLRKDGINVYAKQITISTDAHIVSEIGRNYDYKIVLMKIS